MTESTAPEQATAPSTRAVWSRVGITLIMLAIGIFMIAFGYGYYELSRINVALAQTMSTVSNQTAELSQKVAELESKMAMGQTMDAQQQPAAQSAQNNPANLDKWKIAEANYLVTMANAQLQTAHDNAQAVKLLQQADETLRQVQAANVSDIQRSIASDIETLQAESSIDVTTLYSQLNELNNQVDNLVLPEPTMLSGMSVAGNQQVPSNLPWWKAGLQHTWKVLSKIIVVRDLNQQGLPLVMPEEKTYLYQNLHAMLQNAMWAALNRNNYVYQASLVNALNWTKQYFTADSPATSTFLQGLDALQKVNIKPSSVQLDATLQLFNTANQQ